jgi:large subunit ribosomal protein L18
MSGRHDQVERRRIRRYRIRKRVAGTGEGSRKIALSAAVGKRLAERAKEKGIARACFDRGGYRYHGRVRALADGARAAGLEF